MMAGTDVADIPVSESETEAEEVVPACAPRSGKPPRKPPRRKAGPSQPSMAGLGGLQTVNFQSVSYTRVEPPQWRLPKLFS